MAYRCIVSVEELHKLMPCLNDLLSTHLNFLRLLKKRKDETVVVGAVHEDLLYQFTGDVASKMINSYTSFCSQKDATVRFYNVLYKENLKFKELIGMINLSGFYKTLSLPDCLLRITQRLSKYHQFVETLRKYTVESGYCSVDVQVQFVLDDAAYVEGMIKAERAVKDVVKSVDLGIERIQLEEFRRKIYTETDPKSVAAFDFRLFTPKEIVSEDRFLVYYAEVQWPNAKRHTADVLLLLFSDVIVFMQRNHNGQYSFYSQDGKAGLVSVRKLLVRGKAGKLGSDGVYLIATHPKPEMYEIRAKTKKENVSLMSRIQKTVENYSSLTSPTFFSSTAGNFDVDRPNLELTPANLLTGKETEELRALFDKLPEINENLKLYYENVLKIYQEILSYVNNLVPKIKNKEENEKIVEVINECMDSYLGSIRANVIAPGFFGDCLKQRIVKKLPDLDENEIEDDDLLLKENNNVRRASTFNDQVVRNSGRRKAFRKHATVSGITDVDLRPAPLTVSADAISNDEKSSTPVETNDEIAEEKIDDNALAALLNDFAETKVELIQSKELITRLECELMLANEQIQNRPFVKPQSSADSHYETLEELRKLHVGLDEKKNDYLRLVEDKQFDMNRREKALAEREAKAEREDNELRAKWGALYHAWEQQRFNGLPVTPLTPPMSNGTSPSSDLHTVAAPTVYYQQYPPPSRGPPPPPAQFYPVPPGFYHPPPPSQMAHPPPVQYRNGPSVPVHLQGSLVHHDSAGFEEKAKAVLPSKLSKSSVGAESISSRFRASSKKKSSNQILPGKLSSGKK